MGAFGGLIGGIIGGLGSMVYPILLLVFMTSRVVVEAFRRSGTPASPFGPDGYRPYDQ